MSDDSQGYNIAAIRRLLLAAVADGAELRRLCLDYEALQPVVTRFGPGQGLDDMVDRVIDYCRTQLTWEALLAAVKEHNPAQYARFEAQLRAAGVPLPTATAPVISTPFNLPSDLADFTGREAEVADLRRLLDRSSAAIIAGMGGVGKTVLAVHLAHQLAAEGRGAGARLYIDLKGTAPQALPAGEILGALLSAVLGPDPRRPTDEAELAGLWQTTMRNREALLLLDDAAKAAQVRPLLPGCPTCTVLITSRQRFTLPGAGLMDLSWLPVEGSRTLLQALAPRLDDRGADEIARLCGGLPLTLRIAGNYLALNDDCSVGEYAKRLADVSRLRDPDDPRLDVLAEISLSVDQLDRETRRAWALLGLFPAPFDAAAAAALWGTNEEAAVDRLRGLRNRSLVSYDGKTSRYDQQNLLRSAAAREMAAGEVEAAREGLARHYLTVARVAGEKQRYPALDADWPHLRAALDAAYAAGIGGQDPGLLSDLVYSLNDYWSARGMAREWATWCRRAAEACAAAGRRQDEGAHLGNLGLAYADLGETPRAIEYNEQALAIARETGNQRGEGDALTNLGNAYADLGETQRAISYYEQALVAHRAVRDASRSEVERKAGRLGEGSALANLGVAYAELGEAQRAIDYDEQALAIHREVGDRSWEGADLGYLGQAYSELGETRRAIEYQEQALAIAREIGDRRGEAAGLANLGIAYKELGETQRAIDYYAQALVIHREIGRRRAEGVDLANLGVAYEEMGDLVHAREALAGALPILEELEDSNAEWVREWLAEHDTDSHG